MSQHTVGLVGAGSMAATHAQAWAELGVDVIVWSPRSGQSFAAARGLEAAATFEELLAASTIIDVTSPTPYHAEQIRAAIAVDLPIICEKPLARSADVARDLVLSAEAAGIPLFPAHVVRYMRPYETARAAVASGTLGRVTSASFLREAATPAGGTWFDDDASSGGILLDFLIHDFDQARWMFGEVLRVEATQTPATADGVVPRLVEARVTLTHRGGATTTITGSWGDDDTPFRAAFRIEGAEGLIEHDTASDDVNEDAVAATGAAANVPVDDAYRDQLRDFLTAIDDGTPARVTAEDGLAAVRIADAVSRSSVSGRPVGLI